MTQPADFTVALHVGAHKTATSHLQLSLQVSLAALAAKGVQFYGPEYFRLPGRSLYRLFGLHKRASRRAPGSQLEILRKGGHRVVMSEENFIGMLQDAQGHVDPVRYPMAADRVAALSAAMDHPLDLFLSIRHPAEYLSAAYSQMLLGARVIDVATFRQRNPVAAIDWLALVDRLRQAHGVRSLTVWRFEEYVDLFPVICAGLVGFDAARHMKSVGRIVHPSLSALAVADVLRRQEAGEKGRLATEARAQYPAGDGQPKFSAFNTDEYSAASAEYDQQTAAIAQLDGVTFLSVAPTGLNSSR